MTYTPTPEEDWSGFFDAYDNFTGQELIGPFTGTDYYILEREGPRHHYMVRDGKYSIVRHLMIRDADLANFMTDFGGGYDWTPSGQCTTYLPASYPGMSWMIVSDIDTVPTGDRDFMLGWDKDGAALVLLRDVTVLYEIKDFITNDDDPVIPEGTMLQIHTDFSTSATVFPNAGTTWYVPGQAFRQPVDTNFNIVAFESNSTLDLMWKFVSIPNWPAIGTYAGTVNDKVFFGYPPGTVMYLGCQAESTFASGFQATVPILWKLTFKFQTKMVYLDTEGPASLEEQLTGEPATDYGQDIGGWNYFLNPSPKTSSGATGGTPEYQQLVLINSSDPETGLPEPIFPVGNLLELFYIGGVNDDGEVSFDVNQGDTDNGAQPNTEIQLLTNDPELLSPAPYPP